MPKAIKILERIVEDVQLDTDESTTALPSPQQQEARKGKGLSIDPDNIGASHSSADTLYHEFIVTGIDMLLRLSKGTVPSRAGRSRSLRSILRRRLVLGFSATFHGTWPQPTVVVENTAEMTLRVFLVTALILPSTPFPP